MLNIKVMVDRMDRLDKEDIVDKVDILVQWILWTWGK